MLPNNLKKIIFYAPLLFVLVLLTNCSPKLYTTGKEFASSGNHEDAIEQFTKLIQEDPEFTDAYIARAESYEKLGNLKEAAEDYKRASVFKDNDADLFFKAGKLFFELENYAEAIPFLAKTTSLDKKHIEAFKLKMHSYIALEQYDKALIESNAILKLDDENASHFYWHGFISDKLKNYTQAESDFRKVIQMLPNDIKSYTALADVLYKAKKYDQAITICTNALNIDQKSKEALWIRSKVYHKKIDYPNAINDLSKMIIFAPDDEEAYFTRAKYYQEFNQHTGAINDFNKVISLNPDNIMAYYLRAKSHEEVTNYEKAKADYAKYLSLVGDNKEAAEKLKEVQNRLYELKRESDKPQITLLAPAEKQGQQINIVEDATKIIVKGQIIDESPIKYAKLEGNDVLFKEDGENNEFEIEVDVTGKETISFAIADVYNNVNAVTYTLNRTEINPPEIKLIAPYASATNEIYLEADNRKLYIEGKVADESVISSIIIESMNASFQVETLNPEFFATIDITNKNKFLISVEDIYGNITEQEFTINREAVEMSQDNPMGKTWVIFIENSNYETFASLNGPVKDISMMKAALANYKIHNIIHKKDLSKQELAKFFSIELRDLVKANHVNSLLVWYAGHGKFINETGYWVPVDAQRDNEFTYFNINNLKAALQGYSKYITHTLVITDACESGPSFYQAMRSVPEERDCADWKATQFKSSQVFSSAGYELALDNSQFTRTFANSLMNNPNACLPIENIVSKVTVAVAKSGQQKPQFGKIAGLEDEGGTFFFISK